MLTKKTYLSRNSDILVPIVVVVRKLGTGVEAVNLNVYKQIDVFIRHISDVEPFLKFTTKDIIPENYDKVTINNNRLLVPIKREKTKNKQDGDLFFSVVYYEDNAEFKHDVKKGQTSEKYLTTLRSPVGYNFENI